MSLVIARRGDVAAQQNRPSAPLNVEATAGSGEIVLTWEVPLDSGTGAIINYSVSVNPTTGVSGETTRLTGSAATGMTFTGLTNGTNYTFTVRAVNGVGIGSISAPSNAIAPNGSQTAPVLPTNFTTQYNNGVVTFSFNEVAGATQYRIETEFVSE